jgi:hypothetical protein
LVLKNVKYPSGLGDEDFLEFFDTYSSPPAGEEKKCG